MSNVKLQLNNLEVPVNHFTFNGGEEQVAINQASSPKGKVGYVDITAKLKSSQDVMTLVMLTDACRHIHNLDDCARFTLHMPYIPYARQDRVMNAGEAAAVKAFVNVIAGLKFDKIVVSDPHSDVATNLLDNIGARLEVISQDILIGETMKVSDDYVIIAPDAGAKKKAEKTASRYSLPFIEAGKTRDVSNGKITGTVVHGDVYGKKCLIVDDILDGGGTFKALGSVLKELGASRVDLYITHGIFASGVDCFEGVLDNIFCHNVWLENVEGRNKNGILKVPG